MKSLIMRLQQTAALAVWTPVGTFGLLMHFIIQSFVLIVENFVKCTVLVITEGERAVKQAHKARRRIKIGFSGTFTKSFCALLVSNKTLIEQ